MAGSLGGCRWGLVAGIVAGMLLVGATGSAQAQGPPSTCLPGADGIGDEYFPTYGNGGYNVGHYDLDIAYDPAADALDGRASISATATQSLCSFDLDLVGLQVREIEVNDQPATWTRSSQELIVTPQRALRSGRSFEVAIHYDGKPTEFLIPGTTIRTGFMDTPEGATVAGQPEVAAGWFPVNDHPLDKASYSFDVTVPDGFEVVANGFFRGADDVERGTTWRWEAPEPMASYLATIDIADDWEVNTDALAGAPPRYDAVDSHITGGLRAEIDSSLAKQGEILDALSDAFGPYPFGTVGAIVPNQNDLFFALETQTRPVYSKLFWLDRKGNPENADFVVVHELAHQWYGDDVALARWQDIWLNEGFATYAEWLWEEHEGRATPQEIFESTYHQIPGPDAFWSVVIGDPGVDLLFDNAVYVRGAMTLQALRNEVGDGAFFAILRQWASSQSGGNGTTPEFITLAEQISGQNLDDLFDTWLFTDEKPSLAEAGLGGQPATEQVSEEAASWLDDLRTRLHRGRF
jgi:aminopeptidase N